MEMIKKERFALIAMMITTLVCFFYLVYNPLEVSDYGIKGTSITALQIPYIFVLFIYYTKKLDSKEDENELINKKITTKATSRIYWFLGIGLLFSLLSSLCLNFLYIFDLKVVFWSFYAITISYIVVKGFKLLFTKQ